MNMTKANIFEGDEPLSKALDEILRTGTAVFVIKNKQLFGLIDDRNMRFGISNASKTKCESACIKCSAIKQDSRLEEKLEAFLAGHFKTLPVLDGKGKIIGAVSRTDLLQELYIQKLIPHTPLYQYMNKPVYTVNYEQSIADAKSIMKKTGAHYLVVLRSGNVVGTISTFDFTGFLTTPKKRQAYQLISQVTGTDSIKIGELMRENFSSIAETASLNEASTKMIEERVSHVIVVADKKPVGILSATDIFKLVRTLCKQEKEMRISGLDESMLVYYKKIKDAVLARVIKFEKSFKIENIAVHIKKGKSVYQANMQFDLNNKHIAFKCEGYTLEEAIAVLSKELKILFEKAKSEKIDYIKSRW